MADQVKTATFVFCPNRGVAQAWDNLEYGVDYIPDWADQIGWVGPQPPEFIVKNEGATYSALHSVPDAQKLYGEICGEEKVRKLHKRGFTVDPKFIKVVVVLNINADGHVEGRDDLESSIHNFNVMNSRINKLLTYQALILVFQDKRITRETQDYSEKIKRLLFQKTGEQLPPKIYVSTTSNVNFTFCSFEALNDMAACMLHFAAEKSNWENGFLWPVQQEPYSQVSTIGLRGFFWERVRAIDISRKKCFRKISDRWLEGDGWTVIEGNFPARWPESVGAWRRLLWDEMKAGWQNRENVPKSETMEEEVVSVVAKVNEELDVQLRAQLKVGNADVATQDKIVRRTLNLISIITKKRINDQFEVLPEAIKRVKKNIEQSFKEWQTSLLERGVGLSVLKEKYADSIRELNKIQAEAHKQNRGKSYDNPRIMRLAKDTSEALVKIPAMESSFFSTLTIFSFLLCLSFYLSHHYYDKDLWTSLFIGAGISLIISISIIYFYLKKQTDIHNSLLRDFNTAVTENTEFLMRHRLDCALEEIIDGTDEEPGAIQLMVAQEKALIGAVEAGKRDLEVFKEKVNIPDEIRTEFFYSQNPVNSLYANEWNEDIQRKTDQWAESYWENRKFKGKLPDNFISQWQSMTTAHREFLLEESPRNQLESDVIRANVWEELKKTNLRTVPQQAQLNAIKVKPEHLFEVNQIYSPLPWKEDLETHAAKGNGRVVHHEVLNKNAVCIFNIIDGLRWEATFSSEQISVFIYKNGEDDRKWKKRGKLDLDEVRKQLNSKDLKTADCFLWEGQESNQQLEWKRLGELNADAQIVHYFPFIGEVAASALAWAVQQASRNEGVSNLDYIPPPTSSLSAKSTGTIDANKSMVEPNDDQKIDINEVIKNTDRLVHAEPKDYKTEIENGIQIIQSKFVAEDINKLIAQMNELAEDGGAFEGQQKQIEYIETRIKSGDGLNNDYGSEIIIRVLADLFYSVAAWDGDGFTKSEKEKVFTYLEDWNSQP